MLDEGEYEPLTVEKAVEISAKVYNSDNEYQYKETILYAKWEKSN